MDADRAERKRQFDAEIYLLKKLDMFGIVFAGITDKAKRAQRARDGILEANLGNMVMGRNRAGKVMTFSEALQTVYGDVLEH